MKTLLALCLVSLAGCEFIPGTLTHARKTETYSYASLTQSKADLLTDLRACLRAASGDLDKQKGCAVYHQALVQLDVKQH